MIYEKELEKLKDLDFRLSLRVSAQEMTQEDYNEWVKEFHPKIEELQHKVDCMKKNPECVYGILLDGEVLVRRSQIHKALNGQPKHTSNFSFRSKVYPTIGAVKGVVTQYKRYYPSLAERFTIGVYTLTESVKY